LVNIFHKSHQGNEVKFQTKHIPIILKVLYMWNKACENE